MVENCINCGSLSISKDFGSLVVCGCGKLGKYGKYEEWKQFEEFEEICRVWGGEEGKMHDYWKLI